MGQILGKIARKRASTADDFALITCHIFSVFRAMPKPSRDRTKNLPVSVAEGSPEAHASERDQPPMTQTQPRPNQEPPQHTTPPA